MLMLEIDLTHETTRITNASEDVTRYLGGRGLATKLCWDLIPPGTDPLGPDNILHVGVGPITGLVGDKTVFSFKSPLTGWKGRSTMSGYFGREVIYAGYKAGILIRGQASHPVYLYIWDDDAQIRDATDLWGAWKRARARAYRVCASERTAERNG